MHDLLYDHDNQVGLYVYIERQRHVDGSILEALATDVQN